MLSGRESLFTGEDEIAKVMQKCTAHDVNLRFGSVLELIGAMERLAAAPGKSIGEASAVILGDYLMSTPWSRCCSGRWISPLVKSDLTQSREQPGVLGCRPASTCPIEGPAIKWLACPRHRS